MSWSVGADLCELDGHAALIERARRDLGDLYVLANLAAVLRRRGSVEEVTTTKGGVTSMCRGLVRTYGPQGITVNAVSPGQVETPMLLTDLDPAICESMRAGTPLGYVPQPEEMTGPVVFLASDHARYTTGTTLDVCGGFLMY